MIHLGNLACPYLHNRHHPSGLGGQRASSINPDHRYLRESLSGAPRSEGDVSSRLYVWIQQVRHRTPGREEWPDIHTTQKPGCLGKRRSGLLARTVARTGYQQNGDACWGLRKYVRIPNCPAVLLLVTNRRPTDSHFLRVPEVALGGGLRKSPCSLRRGNDLKCSF